MEILDNLLFSRVMFLVGGMLIFTAIGARINKAFETSFELVATIFTSFLLLFLSFSCKSKINMSKKITFSAFGRDSYYHRDWFKKNGFKFDRSSRKWTVENLPIDNAEEFASYCRKYGLTFERSDRMITEFDYSDYLWDGRRDEFMKPSENIEIPQPKNKI